MWAHKLNMSSRPAAVECCVVLRSLMAVNCKVVVSTMKEARYPLHVLGVVLQTADELCDRMALEADLVHRVEQREPAAGGRS